MDTSIPGSGMEYKGGKRGDGTFCSFCLSRCRVLGGGRQHIKGKKIGEWGEKFLCFMQKSLKERETSKQVINNMPTCSPEPKQHSQSRPLQISSPSSPTALSKPLVRDGGWLSCQNTQAFQPWAKISTLVLCSLLIRTSPVCFSTNFSTPSASFPFYCHPSPTFLFLNPWRKCHRNIRKRSLVCLTVDIFYYVELWIHTEQKQLFRTLQKKKIAQQF